jgi:chromate transport protein ChrA
VTAGVVGMIGATTVGLARAAAGGWREAAIAGAALALLYLWSSKLATPGAVLLSGLAGYGLLR